jgi:hypothetical protein
MVGVVGVVVDGSTAVEGEVAGLIAGVEEVAGSIAKKRPLAGDSLRAAGNQSTLGNSAGRFS